MNGQKKATTLKRNDGKSLLTAIKLTTTVGAVSLTLAGWGLLSAAEAITAAANPSVPAAFTSAAPALAVTAAPTHAVSSALRTAPVQNVPSDVVTPSTNAGPASSGAAPTAMSTVSPDPTVTPDPTATPNATATPEVKVTLDIVQWVTTQAGDPVAVVRDNQGTLWYVMGTDVPLMEQGLDPTTQPQPVNQRARSRGS